MGRYLAAGVASEIMISKKSYTTTEEFKKIKEKIKKRVEAYIDVNTYDIEENEENIYYGIKEKFFDEHIHELMKEINPLLDMKSYFLFNMYRDNYDNIDVNSDDFNSKNYSLKLKYFKEDYKFASEYEKSKFIDEYGLLVDKEIHSLDKPFFRENLWMIINDSELLDSVNIYTSYLLLWCDIDKIDGEDESYIIKLLNTFSRTYFITPLSKNLHFYITG